MDLCRDWRNAKTDNHTSRPCFTRECLNPFNFLGALLISISIYVNLLRISLFPRHLGFSGYLPFVDRIVCQPCHSFQSFLQRFNCILPLHCSTHSFLYLHHAPFKRIQYRVRFARPFSRCIRPGGARYTDPHLYRILIYWLGYRLPRSYQRWRRWSLSEWDQCCKFIPALHHSKIKQCWFWL